MFNLLNLYQIACTCKIYHPTGRQLTHGPSLQLQKIQRFNVLVQKKATSGPTDLFKVSKNT